MRYRGRSGSTGCTVLWETSRPSSEVGVCFLRSDGFRSNVIKKRRVFPPTHPPTYPPGSSAGITQSRYQTDATELPHTFRFRPGHHVPPVASHALLLLQGLFDGAGPGSLLRVMDNLLLVIPITRKNARGKDTNTPRTTNTSYKYDIIVLSFT